MSVIFTLSSTSSDHISRSENSALVVFSIVGESGVTMIN